uniref:Uncharacterized protein n=1 Tax=Human herpesvirus 2 TaxID=10310 RepID=A0A481TT09_HHV2|nr:hypothetical protein [Human alphaherpesvirus 2]QBH83671.1 hypothetical protein [Human alphaherpesvirus 2]QBH84532.1 hypothetical protein [Human alphaherpesvirus 2]QBH85308.1 hypothetical protein [Human alphaherpesvirus 2]
MNAMVSMSSRDKSRAGSWLRWRAVQNHCGFGWFDPGGLPLGKMTAWNCFSRKPSGPRRMSTRLSGFW